ncbi:hypothetical protein OH77DRAFT_1520303 [Trametes cingulata]|nr:hypothetical protein OH77DRAFT_1520303 [Trametes cingulata]
MNTDPSIDGSASDPIKGEKKKKKAGSKYKGKKKTRKASYTRLGAEQSTEHTDEDEQSGVLSGETRPQAIQHDVSHHYEPTIYERQTTPHSSPSLTANQHHAEADEPGEESTLRLPPVWTPAPTEEPVEESKTPANAPWEDVFQYALNASILSGRFEDLRIVAYSQRAGAHRVENARVLHANGILVERTLPVVRLLSARGDNSKAPHSEDAEDYGYSDDSDLEDGPEPDEAVNARNAGVGQAEPRVGCMQPERQGLATDHCEGPADLTRENQRGESPSEEFVSVHTPDHRDPSEDGDRGDPGVDEAGDSPIHPFQRSQQVRESLAHVVSEPSSAQRTIVVTDAAFQTWRALVFYAYTHRIAFAPLRSQGLTATQADDAFQPPTCSPKSMYRLAEKYGNHELQQLAKDDIASKLTAQNILDEFFSRFTSRYPEIQEMQLDILMEHLKDPDVSSRLLTWVNRFASGELKECASTFGRLINKLTSAAESGGAAVD